jgi:hypothetical protein
MKARLPLIALLALLAAGGVWLAIPARREHSKPVSSEMKPGTGTGPIMPADGPKDGQMLRPPDPDRRFSELTPEQRVQLARRGPIGG